MSSIELKLQVDYKWNQKASATKQFGEYRHLHNHMHLSKQEIGLYVGFF